ncbi:Dyp-type peroxidase [Thiolapillus sp.]
MTTQPGILLDNPPLARFMTFSLHNPDALNGCLRELGAIADGERIVVGLGPSLVQALGARIDGLRDFPVISSAGLDIPATPAALWCWLRGEDRGELFHDSRLVESLLGEAFALGDCIDSFKYTPANRDLSGYEDGTENPKGEEAVAAAVVQGKGPGLDGSSFVAVQQWLHDFDLLDEMETAQTDDLIGRRLEDNEEFDEAPESAHVKRSAQESFEPEAFILRHSMPWAEDLQGGLVFVAFGKSLDAFEAILRRMAGLEDGIQDGLFRFTRPLSGAYFWCPPVKNGKLDLSAVGL